MLVALVELIADEGRHQRLDAAGPERDQEQTGVEARAVVVERREAGVARAVHEREPQHRVVLAEEPVGEPAAEQREEVDADDEGVEDLLGEARALGLRRVQQEAADQERRQDVAHPVEAEALASLVRDDVGDLARQAAARNGGGRVGNSRGHREGAFALTRRRGW